MRLLLIEDDSVWTLRIQMLLEKIGFSNIKSATSKKQAIEYYFDYQPNLIISDILLGNEDVFSIFKHNKMQLTPTIFMSANATQKHVEQIKKLPNATLLEKPFGELTLNTCIHNLMPKSNEYEFLREQEFNLLSSKIIFDAIKKSTCFRHWDTQLKIEHFGK